MTRKADEERSSGGDSNEGQTHGSAPVPCLTLVAADVTAFLQQAATRTGLYPLGRASARVADALGEAWVGPGAQTISKPGLGFEVKVSVDKLRQYRSPVFKPKRRVT